MTIGTREPVSKHAIFYRPQVVYTAALYALGLGPKHVIGFSSGRMERFCFAEPGGNRLARGAIYTTNNFMN